MACAACAKKNQTSSVNRTSIRQTVSSCDYTAETTDGWLTILKCVNENNLLDTYNIQKALYNSFLGILLSVKKSPYTVCYFKKELDVIKPYIVNIINSGTCQ